MVTPSTPLRELQAIARATHSVRSFISEQMVQSIQQSLRMEGYVVTAASIRAAARRAIRAEGARL